MRGPTGRHPPIERSAPDHRLTTPTPVDPWQFNAGGGGNRRDSDASFCSSRPSSSQSTGANHHRTSSGIPITDRSYQLHAISTINSYLSAYSIPILFKLKPLPSNKDINETLKFVLTHLDYPPSGNKMEDDLFIFLKYCNCPIKINKSAFKAPGTPHSFPGVLAVLHWLVQLAMYNEHLLDSAQSQSFFGDSMISYTLNTYIHFIKGDDDAVDREDENFMEKLQQEINSLADDVKQKSESVTDLEGKLEAMKSGPSLRQSKEDEKNMLEMDVKKFNELIEQLKARQVKMENEMKEKEKELSKKIVERNNICEENADLKKQVEEQAFNLRDAERMKRELQSVEKDIEESEFERNKWEAKCWDLDAVMGTKLKELEALQIECNQNIRRLKLGHDIQYQLNAKGLTPAEVLGMDYKSTLKTVLSSFSDEVKRTSMENLESFMSFQKLARDFAAKIDAKRNRIAMLQSRIEEVETHLNSIKDETLDYTSRCATEARQLVENFEAESHNVDVVEKEARELVRSSEAKLQETVMECQEEVQMCARELLALIDSVSKYKEFTLSKILEIKNDVSKTADTIAQIYTSNPPI